MTQIRSTVGYTVTKRKGLLDWASGLDGDVRPLFPPEHPDEASAQIAIVHVVRRDPRQFGYDQSRWTLRTIAQSCDWLQVTTEGGLSQILKRLGISYKRGRDYIHSPDPHYMDKLSLIELCRLRAFYAPETYVFLYLDEFSYYRQPSLSKAYEARGHQQPLARRSYRPNTRFRGIGALNAITGQVTYRQHSAINRPTLAKFFSTIHADYPHAEEIYVVVDNWPVHFHPDVLVYLQPQDFPWPPPMPGHWPTTTSIQPDNTPLPLRLLCLPTYASWLNPIEKLWRWLKQDVLHLHRLSNDWQLLKQLVLDFFDQFRNGSAEVLSYVGLLPN